MDIEVTPDLKSDLTHVAPGLAVYSSYRFEVDDPALPGVVSIEIRMDGRAPTCHSFRVQQRAGGEPITAEAIRQIPLAGMVRHSVEWALWEVRDEKPGKALLVALSTQEQITAGYMATARQKPYTEERIQQVANLYNEALRDGKPPTKYVEQSLPASRSTTARLVREARKRRLIPARGKAT